LPRQEDARAERDVERRVRERLAERIERELGGRALQEREPERELCENVADARALLRRQRTHEPERRGEGGPGPREADANVAVGLRAEQRARLVEAARGVRVVTRVSHPKGVLAVAELLRRERSNAHEQREPPALLYRADVHERLVAQRGDPIDDGLALHLRDDGLRRVHPEAPREDRALRERSLFALREEIPRPIDRGRERRMARGAAARAAREHVEALAEPRRELRRRNHPRARSGELDREWNPVELPHERAERARIGAELST